MAPGDGNFWLALHELAKSLENEGNNRSQRQEAILEELSKMRPVAADAYRTEYRFLVEELAKMRRSVLRKRKS